MVSRSVTVKFDCPGGWEAVLQHVNECMLDQGYSDTSDELLQHVGVGSGENDEGFEELKPAFSDPEDDDSANIGNRDWSTFYHAFQKKGAKYSVVLQCPGLMMKIMLKDMPGGAPNSTGITYPDYSLTILEY